MDTVSSGGVKEDVLSMTVPQTKDVTHHGHNGSSVGIGQSAGVPVHRDERL